MLCAAGAGAPADGRRYIRTVRRTCIGNKMFLYYV